MFLKQLLISLLVTSATADHAYNNYKAPLKAHEVISLAEGFILGATEAEFGDIQGISKCLMDSKILFNDIRDVVDDFAEHSIAGDYRAIKAMGRMSNDIQMLV
jgi:hypothetical protein